MAPPFTFEPPRVSNAGTLSSLMTNQGLAQAQAADQRGAIWGRTAENIGGTLAGLAQAPALVRKQALEEQKAQMQLQLQQEQLTEAQRKRHAEETIAPILARNLGKDGRWNVDGLTVEFQQHPTIGHMAQGVLGDAVRSNETLDKIEAQRATGEDAILNSVIEGMLRPGASKTPDQLVLTLRALGTRKVIREDTANAFFNQMDQSSPEAFDQSLRGSWRGKPETFTLKDGERRYQQVPGQPAQITAEVPEKPPTAEERWVTDAAAVIEKQSGQKMTPQERLGLVKMYSDAHGNPALEALQTAIAGLTVRQRQEDLNKPEIWIRRLNSNTGAWDKLFIRKTDYRQGDIEDRTGENRKVSGGDAGRVAEFDTALDDVKVLKDVLSVKGGTGTIASIKANAPSWLSDWTGWGTSEKSRQAVIDRVKQVIGKTLEGGVLRKEDELKYEKILPTIKDPELVAASKMEGLAAAVEAKRGRFIDALEDASYDVAKFRARTPAPASPKPEGWTTREKAEKYLEMKGYPATRDNIDWLLKQPGINDLLK